MFHWCGSQRYACIIDINSTRIGFLIMLFVSVVKKSDVLGAMTLETSNPGKLLCWQGIAQ